MVLYLVLCCVSILLQITRCSSKGKDIVSNDSSSLIAKRARLSSKSSRDSTIERFRTPIDSKIYTIVEQIVKFDTLGTTFIPKIFEERDWANLFGNFEDPIEELVKEFYSNAKFTGAKLKCWYEEQNFPSMQTTILRYFASPDQKMWIEPHMMTEYFKHKTSFKFVGMNMKWEAQDHL